MGQPGAQDDELPELPPLDGEDEEQPRADEEEGEGAEEEGVGLDDEEAGDDGDDEIDAGDESESYLDGSEPDARDDDDDLEVDGEEGGWAEGDAPAGGAAADDDDEPVLDEADEPLAALDRGEEGLEDEEPVRGTEGDEADLPPATAPVGAADLPDDALDVREDAEVEASDVGDADGDATQRLAGTVLPPAFGGAVRTRWIALHGGAAALAASGDGVLAAGTMLARVGEHTQVLGASGLDALGVSSLALAMAQTDALASQAPRIVVGTRLAGALASDDGGESFAPANGWRRETGVPTRAFDVTLETHAGGARLWGRTGGALYRSEDLARTWVGPLMVAPVAALASCARGERGVVAIGSGPEARLLRSTDGGLRWASEALVARPHGAGQPLLALAGDALAVGWERDPKGPVLIAGGRETRLPELAAASHLALVPVGPAVELWAVLYFDGTDRSVLVWRDARGVLRTVADVAALGRADAAPARDVDDDADGRVLALVVTAHGEARDAWLATSRGVLHVEARAT